jgi:hypothetical protein
MLAVELDGDLISTCWLGWGEVEGLLHGEGVDEI